MPRSQGPTGDAALELVRAPRHGRATTRSSCGRRASPIAPTSGRGSALPRGRASPPWISRPPPAPRSRKRLPRRRAIRASRRPGPSCSSTSTTPRKRPRPTRRHCRPTRAGCRRWSAMRRRWPTTIRRRPAPAWTGHWPSTPTVSRRTCGWPSRRSTAAGSPTRQRRSPRYWPSIPIRSRRCSLQAAIAARIAPPSRRAGAAGAHALAAGSGAVHRIIGAHLAGHYRFRGAVARGRKALPSLRLTRARRPPGHAPAADRRRGPARLRWTRRSAAIRSTSSPTTRCRARHARPLPDDHHRRRA